MIVLSHFQTATLLAARRAKQSAVSVSFDLGCTCTDVTIDADSVRCPGELNIEWATIERIDGDENGCFAVDGNGCTKLIAYSEENQRPYSLYPTVRAPALLLSGVTMHRIKGIDPLEDTERKINTIAPVSGAVLDTATGLGYTAIAASRTARQVTTIELDPKVIELARRNPWSAGLFDNAKITQIIGDSSQRITAFADQSFDRIIHDPPMISIAGDLYATTVYQDLWRVLRPGGRLFHYIGDPDSPGGRRTTDGVTRRLGMVGFKRVVPHAEAFGVVAFK